MFRFILLLTAVIGTSAAQAEVTNTAENGFTVKHLKVVNGSPEEVWKTIIAPARWWNGEHSFSGNADNFYLVAQAGGCFCELLRKTDADNIKSAEGSVQHMRVIFAQNNKALRMSGALGPLQGEAVTGTLTIGLKADGEKTGVSFVYKVGGYMEFPVDQIAPAVDGVIGEQLTRLAALFAETEEPEAEPESDPEEGEKAE
ncbi:SRPBCC family protein [Parasphingorhabdus cellanae]|uniref:SRPBCC family protein n=1 Tax=Parasphingorhabdus cellanae TaxID=2806553 RepID=A0ABX7T601_9SPHN|nr:SRPBCC family protein [Parasphingorhabdus cellanae]QTD55665.1 SRPBCC family protein [Parasphingorhabdus cellanae]